MSDEVWLEGVISIEAALISGSRDVKRIYVRQGKWDNRVQRLLKTAESIPVKVKRVDPDFIKSRVSGSSHGGVMAQVGPRKFVKLDDLIAGKADPFVVMLDGIEDPFNFGQAVRALYAAGVDGLVVRPRNWTSAAGVVARSSAGASERMPMAVAETSLAAAQFYRQRGLTIACTAREKAASIYETNLKMPLFLLIGGEKRGITRSFINEADIRLRIPYGRKFPHSLGTASSAAIFAFEIMRQRT